MVHDLASEMDGSFSDGLWAGLYTGALVDFDGIVHKAAALGNANQQAVGRVMRAWMFHNMVDLWGNIPYSEALGGLSNANITPKYDDASGIYNALLAELTSASSQIVPTGSLFPDVFRGTVGNPDLIYEGDMENNDGWGAYRSVPDIIEFWATYLDTPDMETTYLPDVNPDDGSTVRLDLYSSPKHDRELCYYLVLGGGHEWPGVSGNMDIEATIEIWNFFDGLSDEPCTPGDFNGDHVVDVLDLLLVISQWDNPYTVADLLTVIGQWDSTC